MKSSKIFAPKVISKGYKTLNLARCKVVSVVEVGQQQPHCQSAEMNKYIRYLTVSK